MAQKNGMLYMTVMESALSSCMIYPEPDIAKNQVEEYIKNKM